MVDQDRLEFRMPVGKAILGLRCSSEEHVAALCEYFQVESSKTKADVSLRMELADHAEDPVFPNNLFTTKTFSKSGFSISDDLIYGNYDPKTCTGSIKVKYILTKGHYTRIFEQFLYQAFYSARKGIKYDAFLIHSSGVIRESNGQRDGFLFVGASEAGKSTVAELSCDKIITNDEMNLVEFTPEGPILHATGFNGLFFGKDTTASAPLRAVLLLDKGPEHRLSTVTQSKAVTLIASQIAPPVGIEDKMDKLTGLDLLELADRLSTAAAVRKLTFLPDAGFWAALTAEFPPANTMLKEI